MVKKIIVSKIMSDEEIENREGEYFSEKHYKRPGCMIMKEDCDVYTSDGHCLLKLRQKVIPKKLTDLALESYLSASKKKHENRGAAAGVLDRNKLAGYIGEFIKPNKFRTSFKSKVTGVKSDQYVSNMSKSNIIGFYDQQDKRNNKDPNPIPCRLTVFNRDHGDLWKKAIPFLQSCDAQFKKLMPKEHKYQYDRARLTPKFAIPKTAFSTVTINYSWRTALHKDKGDYHDGFGNLVVAEDPNNLNSYEGCYLGFPQYGVCADVRTGDFLAMNVHEWHCNTEFRRPKRQKVTKHNFSDRDIANDWHYNRMSMVMYLRENMIQCASKSKNKGKKKSPAKTKKRKSPVKKRKSPVRKRVKSPSRNKKKIKKKKIV